MTIVINGSGTVTGISAGGFNDAIITQAEMATGVAGTGPAFSAYPTLSQNVSQSVTTKVALQATEFDTSNSFDKTTNYRFQPLVAGYYQVNAYVCWTAAQGTTETATYIYKNGSLFKMLQDGVSSNWTYGGSTLLYLNGSTDYIELWVYTANASTRTINNNAAYTFFQASMVRAA